MTRAAAALFLALASGGLARGAEVPRPETARRELRQILSRPEFRDARPEARRPVKDLDPPSWMQKWTDLVNRVRRTIREALFPPRASGEDASGPSSLFSRASLPGVIAGIVVFLSVVIVVVLRRLRRAARSPIEATEIAAFPADDARLRDATGWEREAEQLFAAGRFREAVRARYLGTLSFLAEKGAIRYESFKTNWEYARDLGRTSEQSRSGFERLTTEFDFGWYGFKNVDARAARDFFASEADWRNGFRL